jgi:hypothetical protein
MSAVVKGELAESALAAVRENHQITVAELGYCATVVNLVEEVRLAEYPYSRPELLTTKAHEVNPTRS